MGEATRHNLYDHIFDRWTEMDGDFAKVNNNRDVVSTYFRSDELIDTDQKGNLLGVKIYNGSGPWFADTMAKGFRGSLISKNIPWIRYRMQELKLKGVDEIDAWLQGIKEHMTLAYDLSNFYDIQPQFTLDGITTGGPVIFGEEDILTERTMWMPQHYKTVRTYYDKFNQAEGVIVKDKTYTAKQLMDRFVGPDDANGTRRKAKLSIQANRAIDQLQLQEVFIVYRATFKVTDPIWDVKGFTKPKGDWKWLSAYFEELTTADFDKKNQPLNDNMGDFTQPFDIWDFDKKPWEAASRTPGWYALWDNLSLQQIDRNYGEDIQTINRPPMIALNTMAGRIRLGPEGEMLVTDAEYDRPPKPIDRVAGIQFSRDLMELKIESLKRWFMVDFFLKFSELIKTNKQPVSAAQIWQMAGEQATMLSPAIESHSSYLEIADARMIDIEQRAGRGPFNPLEMANITDIIQSALGEIVKDVNVRPVFIGPLAQGQKISQALGPIRAAMEEAAEIIAIFPEARHKYRPSVIIDKINEAVDFPQDAVVPEDEYEDILAAENAALIQQQQAQQALEMAKAAPSVSGPVDETSILAGAGT